MTTAGQQHAAAATLENMYEGREEGCNCIVAGTDAGHDSDDNEKETDIKKGPHSIEKKCLAFVSAFKKAGESFLSLSNV